MHAIFVNNMLAEADIIHETKSIRDETIQLLKRDGFEFSKWASNASKLLEDLVSRQDGSVVINNDLEPYILGWN